MYSSRSKESVQAGWYQQPSRRAQQFRHGREVLLEDGFQVLPAAAWRVD